MSVPTLGPSLYAPVSIASALQELLMDEMGDALYLGLDGANIDPAKLAERDLLLAGVMLTGERLASNHEVFYSVWKSKPIADSADVEFWFEGASDADLSGVKSLEVIAGGNCHEFPIEHVSPNLIQAAFRLPQSQILNMRNKRVTSLLPCG